MTREPENVNAGQLAERWWTWVIRGAAAIVFGVLTFILPEISLLMLVGLWAAYAIVDGVLNLVLAARSARAGRRWGWLLLEGLVSVAAGVLAVVWPSITAVALLMVIAAWAVVTGIAELAVAIRLRRQIQGEWMLVLSGILSIALGGLLLAYPGAGVLAVLWMVGAYAIAFGVLLIGLGFRLHGWHHGSEHAGPGAHGLPTSA
jgi:uncharacterized membrane protein HdeD (DUF308 family)